jgi:hypothetical protein
MNASASGVRWDPGSGFIHLPFPVGRYRMTLPVRLVGEPHEHPPRLLSTEFEVLSEAPLPPVSEVVADLRPLAPHACAGLGAQALALAAYLGGTAITTRLPELVSVSAEKQALMDLMAMLPETHHVVVAALDTPDPAVRAAAAVALAGFHTRDLASRAACGALCDQTVAIACGVVLQDPLATGYRFLQVVSENQRRWPPGFGSALLRRFEVAVDPVERVQIGIAMTVCYADEVSCDWVARLGPEMLGRAVRAAERPVPGHPEAEAILRELAGRWKPAPPPVESDGGEPSPRTSIARWAT